MILQIALIQLQQYIIKDDIKFDNNSNTSSNIASNIAGNITGNIAPIPATRVITAENLDNLNLATIVDSNIDTAKFNLVPTNSTISITSLLTA